MRKQNITRLIFIVIVSLVLLSGLYDNTYTSISEDNQIAIIAPEIILDSFDIPDVRFKNLEGKEVLLTDYKDKVILLNFWASWCVPCKKEFPDMIRLVDKFKGDIVLFTVSNDSKKQDIIRFINIIQKKKKNKDLESIINTKRQNIIFAWDKDKKITQDIFKTIKLPETIIISPAKISSIGGNQIGGEQIGREQSQKMVKKITGADINWLGKDIISLIKSLL